MFAYVLHLQSYPTINCGVQDVLLVKKHILAILLKEMDLLSKSVICYGYRYTKALDENQKESLHYQTL
jgi:hypothetical protein